MRRLLTTVLAAFVAVAICASPALANDKDDLIAEVEGHIAAFTGNQGAVGRWQSVIDRLNDNGGISDAELQTWLNQSNANGWGRGQQTLPKVIAYLANPPQDPPQVIQQQQTPQQLQIDTCSSACQTLKAEVQDHIDDFAGKNQGAVDRWQSILDRIDGNGGISDADLQAWLDEGTRHGWTRATTTLPKVIEYLAQLQQSPQTTSTNTPRVEPLPVAIEQGSTEVDGSPTAITISRTQALGPTNINIQSSDTGVRWNKAGSAPVAPGTRHYDGFKLTRTRNAEKIIENQDGTVLTTTVGVGETAYVWTDIQGPSYKPFNEAYTLDVDTDGDGTNDALAIDSFNWSLVTNYARDADDNRDGDTSPGATNRGIVDQDRQFNQGHEIGARFNSVYGVLTCVDPICTINMDGFDLTEMAGWAFTPKIMYDGQGGSRSPQVPVRDNDYRYFGYWLRGPDHATDGGVDIRTFAGGSEPYTGNTYSLTGRATYVGPGGGLYVKDTDGGGSSDGQFTAKVTLHADFGNKQTIAGSMSDFRDGGTGLDWSLQLQQASIVGSEFSGTTRGTTNGKGSADNAGSYEGAFYGGAAGDYPYGVAGTFTGKFDDGAVIGGFGANQEAVHPNHP